MWNRQNPESTQRTISVPTRLGLQQLAAALQAGRLTSVSEQRGSKSESPERRSSYFGSFGPGQQLNNPSVSAEAQPPRDPRGAYLIPLDVNIY